MSITVYSKPNCPQCTMTYRLLDQLSLEYQAVDVTQDQEALEYILSLGHKQAPVVIAGADNHWSGYRPDRLKTLAKQPTNTH